MPITDASGSVAQIQTIPPVYSTTAFNRLRIGRSWSSTDMISLANGINYLNFHGNQVVSSYDTGRTIAHNTATTTRFFLAPNPNITERVWVINGLSVTPGILKVQAGVSTASSYSVNITKTPILYVEKIASPNSQSAVEQVELNVAFSSSTGGQFTWNNSSCFEVPRKTISPDVDADEPGIKTYTLKRNYEIFNSGKQQTHSIGAVARGMVHAKENSRRACLYQRALPLLIGSYDDISGSTVTELYSENVSEEQGKVNIHAIGGSSFDFRVPITTRKKFNTSATGSIVQIYALAFMEDATTTGSLYFMNEDLQAVTMSITGTSAAPQVVSASLPFRYESFQTFNNRPANGQDTCLMEAHVTNGLGSTDMYIKTIALLETAESV